MDSKQLFQKYYRRLSGEGVLRAFVWGLMAGMLTFAVATFIFWLAGYDPGILIALGIGVVVTTICTVVLYNVAFRPTTDQIARRLDEELGLEERMVTMLELSKDESYIAMRQREDAQKRLRSAPETKFSRRVSRLSIGLASGFSALAVMVSAVFVLSLMNFLPRGNEVFGPADEYVNVHYMANDGGTIEGETEQRILLGGKTKAVLAVADEGFMFVQWSDGVKEASRYDEEVKEELFVFPEFVELEFGEDGESGDEPGDPGEQESPEDEPGESGELQPGEPGDENPGGSDSTGSENGMIIDGETDYKEVYEQYYELAKQMLASGEEIPEEMKAFLEAYFGSLL